jgi:hypothetical protein
MKFLQKVVENTHIRDYYSDTKWNEALALAAGWMDPKNKMLGEIRQSQRARAAESTHGKFTQAGECRQSGRWAPGPVGKGLAPGQ